jgi:hypothetical protein
VTVFIDDAVDRLEVRRDQATEILGAHRSDIPDNEHARTLRS